MDYKHDNLENDTDNSGSEFSHIHHDTKKDWDKPKMVPLKSDLQFTIHS